MSALILLEIKSISPLNVLFLKLDTFASIGKPFSRIVDMALEKVQFITGSSIDMSRIGMVGDTLHTDILGANSIGIKSILMTKYGSIRDQNIASCIKKTGIIPDYLIEGP